MTRHRAFPLSVLLTVLLILSSLQLVAQTVIRERVEIQPKQTQAAPLMSVAGSNLFSPGGTTTAVITTPGVRVTVGSVSIT
ncbi:MAG TPA: hypothetical protein VGB10_06035, partial [Bacteroidota bacterium]